MQYGYCGNVHPGRTLAEVKNNLTQYAVPIKQSVFPDRELPVGLWLSATAADELKDAGARSEFRDWLGESGLVPFTMNGFPFGDFHQTVVKHSVYSPNWAELARLDYTIRLADIFDAVLPDDRNGSISTLPLGWPHPQVVNDETFLATCAENLRACGQHLHQIREKTGRVITVCLEPEPGCLLDRCTDVTEFFSRHLQTGKDRVDAITMEHIGVCHDVCHSAVMFEDQAVAIEAYHAAGIRVGKVQVSSAIEADFTGRSESETTEMLRQLSSFVEPRYLHQTLVRIGEQDQFFVDLPEAIAAVGDNPDGRWRVHFHVPIFAEHLGVLKTTQEEIDNCLGAMQRLGLDTHDFEVETYAWNVLPVEWKPESLADGIARELKWFGSRHRAVLRS